MLTYLRSCVIYLKFAVVVVIVTKIANLNMTSITGIWKSKTLAIPTGSFFLFPFPSLLPVHRPRAIISQRKNTKKSCLTVTSIYVSSLSLSNVRSPPKVNVHSTRPHINVSCIVIGCYTFAFIQVISVNLV